VRSFSLKISIKSEKWERLNVCIQRNGHLELENCSEEEQPLETVEFEKEYGSRKMKGYNKKGKKKKIRRRRRNDSEEDDERDIQGEGNSFVKRKDSISRKEETNFVTSRELYLFMRKEGFMEEFMK
jgi:hypothetical protein